MSKLPNPITQGLRTIWRDPAIFLLEAIWRWSFAAAALLVLFCAGLLLLDRVHTDSLASALQTKDLRMIGASLFFTWVLLGIKAIIAVAAVPLLLALIWTCLAAPARRIIVRRLCGAAPLSFRAMLALQMLRAFITWTAYLLVIGAVASAIHIAARGKYDPAIFYSVAAPSIAVIAVVWLTLNWHLTVATIFGREGQTFRGAFRQARQTVRRQRSDFAGTGFVFLLLRLVVLLAAVAICGLTSKMAGTAPQSYFTVLVMVVLVYSAVSYFLYMARMAAYLALAAEHVEPGGPRLVTSSLPLPAENPPSL